MASPLAPTCFSPKRTKHGYLIKWTPVTLTLMDAKIDSANAKEIIFKHLDAHTVKTIEQLDEHCMSQVQAHLPKWFSQHRVDPDELAEKRVLSLMDRIYLPTHVSTLKCIQYIEWNGTRLIDWEALLQALEDAQVDVQDLSGTVEVEAIGIFVHRNSFGIQWIVRRLELTSKEESSAAHDFNLPDRTEIEQQWLREIQKVDEEINQRVNELQKCIDVLLAHKDSIHTNFKTAQTPSLPFKKWNDLLEDLSQEILQFRSGTMLKYFI